MGRVLVTAEEFAALPEDGLSHELVDGELRTGPLPGAEHGATAGAVHGALGRFVYDNPIAEIWGEVGFRLRSDPDTVRAPDVAVVRVERIPSEGLQEGFFPGAPDLAVEVVSPNDAAADVVDKAEMWLRAGAQLVWVVYPSLVRLFVYSTGGQVRMLGPEDEVDGGDVLPGFRMRVGDLLHPFKRG